jgi:NADPH:quinone reductase-like Zn-dependent oxidoreductase
MRAALCRTHGPPELLEIIDQDAATPGPGQVSVRIGAAAVNFPDVLILDNRYQVRLPTPFVPGSEFAGDVVEIGDGVDDIALGDRVFGAAMCGAFAEQICVAADGLTPIPNGVDVETAAAFGVAYTTAYHALRSVADVAPGERVLVLGAAGGVGLAAVEIAQVLGAEVIAAASSAAKLEICRARGAAHTIDYEHTDLRARLREVAPEGVDVVIDPVGGRHAEPALRATRWGGRFVTLGYASGEIPSIPLNLVLLKGVIVKGFEIRTFSAFAPELAARDRLELLELLAAGRLVPHISATYPLEETARALRFVADRKATGKVLIRP